MSPEEERGRGERDTSLACLLKRRGEGVRGAQA